MKNARERGKAEVAQRPRAEQASDQETARISASQLAEVLARVDGERPTVTPEERGRTISGARPIVRPPAIRPIAEEKRSSSARVPANANNVVDMADGPRAVVERPVDEDHIVNATSTTTPVSSERIVALASPPNAKATATAPAEATTMAPAEATAMAAEAEATAERLVSAARRSSQLVAAVLVMAIVAFVAALALTYRH